MGQVPPPPPPQSPLLPVVTAEMDHLLYVIADLRGLVAHAGPSAAAVGGLLARYEQRYATVYAQWMHLSGRAPAMPAAAAWSPPAVAPAWGAPAPPPPRAPISARAFLEDNAIVLLSYLGGFLLIVATLLFELYGLENAGGTERFAAVAGLELCFIAAAVGAARRPALRLVAVSYTAISAMLTPLLGLAAYEFLGLAAAGIRSDTALCVGAACCAGIYVALSRSLRSTAYAGLAVVALVIAVNAGFSAGGAGEWSDAGNAALAIALAAVAIAAAREEGFRCFAVPAEVGRHAMTALAVLLSVVAATSSGLGWSWTASLPVTAALLAVAAALPAVLAHRSYDRFSSVAATGLALITTLQWLQPGAGSGAAGLLAAGALAAAPTLRWWRSGDLAHALRLLATVELGTVVLLPLPDAWAALVLGLAIVAQVGIAVTARKPGWLWPAVGLFSVEWYHLGVTVLPSQPPSAGSLTLLYSPLPELLAIGALALRLRGGRRGAAWAVPLWVGAAMTAGFVVLIALDAGSPGVVAATLGCAAAAVAVAGRLQNSPAAPLGSTALAGLALIAAASLFNLDSVLLPLIEAVFAGLVFCAAMLVPQPSVWEQRQRAAATTLASLAAAIPVLVVPLLQSERTAASISSAIAALVLATLVAVEGEIRGRRFARYGAVLLAAAACDWLPVAERIVNPQAYVAVPGLVALICGVLCAGEADARCREWSAPLMGISSGLLLGVTWLQSYSPDGSGYTALLVAEGVAAAALGIAMRRRVLVIFGSIAMALAALRALYLVAQDTPIYVVFGLLATILLVLAAVLALARDDVARLQQQAREQWRTWR